MNDLRAALADADPLRDAPSLPTPDAHVMRRAILGAVETPAPLTFPRALPVAALVVLMIVAGLAAGQRFSTLAVPADAEASILQPDAGERRQVQFSTPGGTRIIWTIDPEFHMRGTLP